MLFSANLHLPHSACKLAENIQLSHITIKYFTSNEINLIGIRHCYDDSIF